jgi:hypothetical protein
VATLAADASAPLRRKVKIYTASALMTAGDRARFTDIIEAVALEDAPAIAGLPATADASATTGPEQPTGPQRPPTGPGSPTAAPDAPRQRQTAQRPAVLRLTPAQPERQAQPRKRAAARASVASGATGGAAKATGVRTPRQRRQPGQSLEADARAAWAAGAHTINAMMVMSGMSRNAAGGWVRTLKAERDAGQLAQ